MRVFVRFAAKGLAACGFAAGLCACTVGSFDLSRGTTASTPPAPPPVQPASAASQPATAPDTGTYTPPPVATRRSPLSEPATTQAISEPSPPPSSYQAPSQPSSRPLPAARGARAPDIPPDPVEPDPDVMTTQRAREQCWMASESTKFARNLDQKVKWVEKCVNDKMRTAGQ